jgi:hypothetical protein
MIEDINESDDETHKTLHRFQSNLQQRIEAHFAKINKDKNSDL